MGRIRMRLLGRVILLWGMTACGPEGGEPARVSLPVVVTAEHLQPPCTNDQGWEVTVTAARVAIADLEFTILGETHALAPVLRRVKGACWQAMTRWLVPEALAHPGHLAGGEVTGELPGAFLADLFAGTSLGQATLLEEDYHGINLTFRKAETSDVADSTDLVVGHTAVLEGTAQKDGRTVVFRAVLDVPEGSRMIGGPFDFSLREGRSATLALALFARDPSEGDTLFDGLDFGALDGDGDGQVDILPGMAAHNILGKTLIRHDHWGIIVR